MAGKFESPLVPLKSFPGDQSGPGIYGHNPHLGPAQDGEPKFKFYEEIDSPQSFILDTPMEDSDIAREKKSITINAGEASRGSCTWDSPFEPIKKL